MVKRSIARRIQLALQRRSRVYARKATHYGNIVRSACVNYAGEDVVREIGERENKQAILHEQAATFRKYLVGGLPYQFDQFVVELKEFNEKARDPMNMKMGYLGMWLYTLFMMICAWKVATVFGRGCRIYGYRYADIDPKLEWKVVEYK